jgi:hypothetical protein
MFGIKHGMHKNELVKILGEKYLSGNTLVFQRYSGFSHFIVEISLENDAIKSISWILDRP